jgi:hypothetical protein
MLQLEHFYYKICFDSPWLKKKTLFGYWGSDWKWGFTCGATCISQRKTWFYVFHLETEVMVMVW